MRYVIYGAGAVGCVLGARLQAAGRDVVLIARGEHYDVLRKHGLTLNDPDGSSSLQIAVCDDPAGISFEPTDILILAMKSQDTDDAFRRLGRLGLPHDMNIVSVQNGVANEPKALRFFEHVYGIAILIWAVLLEPGVVDVHTAPLAGAFDLGRYPSGTDSVSAAICADGVEAHFDAKENNAIAEAKYAKLKRSLLATLEAVAGHAARQGDLAAVVIAEAEACFEAAGITVAPWAIQFEADRVAQLGGVRAVGGKAHSGGAHGSTAQSLLRGTGSIETDYLNGEIVLLGREYGVATPFNQALQAIASRMLCDAIPLGSIRPETIRELAGEYERSSPPSRAETAGRGDAAEL